MKNKNITFCAFLKHQLFSSFLSPVFIISAFVFVFYVFFNFFIKQQFFTGKGSADLTLLFSAIPYICIIVIPCLCWKKSDSVYDDFVPLSFFQKKLAYVLTYLINFVSILILIFPSIIVVNLFGAVDFSQVFTSYICLIFYALAAISICVFVNSVFESGILSLFISVIILAIVNSAHLFAIYVSMNNFVASILKKISFIWHFDAASKGILDTRDLIFLLSVSAFFIICTILCNQIKLGKKFNSFQIQKYTLLFLITIFVSLNSSKYFLRIDFSKNKTYSISTYTKELLKKADSPIKITYFRSNNLSKLYPQIRDVSDFLNEYTKINKNISLNIKNPDNDSTSINLLQSYGISSQQMRSVKNNSTEFVQVFSAIVIEYMGNHEIIPFVMSADLLEYDLSGRINHLLTNKKRIVNIIVANGLSLQEDYGYVVPWLESQGFICNQINIHDFYFSEILQNSTGPLLLIGDSELKINHAVQIEDYVLSNKGNLFAMVSPYSFKIEEDWSLSPNKNTNMVEILENWGVKFRPSFVSDISCARITMMSDDSQAKVLNYPYWVNILPQENSKSGMTIFWPTELELSQNATPFLVSSPSAQSIPLDSFQANPFIVQESDFSEYKRGTKILCANISGELNGLFTTNSTNNSNIIVIPDQYFVNSLMTGYIGGEFGDYRNFEFLTNCLLKLNNEEELSKLHDKAIKDKSLFKVNNLQDFTSLQNLSYIILFVIVPLFVILMICAIYFVKKSRKI